jgi:hypothetical protein
MAVEQIEDGREACAKLLLPLREQRRRVPLVAQRPRFVVEIE